MHTQALNSSNFWVNGNDQRKTKAHMTVFWREYSDRESHWCQRDIWGNVSQGNPSAREKDAWVYQNVRNSNTFDQQLFPNAICPECRKDVYFFRHKSGGCAWFNDVPWPWPKHECMDLPQTKCSSDHLKIQEQEEKIKNREPIWAVFSPARFCTRSDPRDNRHLFRDDWGIQTPHSYFESFCMEYGQKLGAELMQGSLKDFWHTDKEYTITVQGYYDARNENIFEVLSNRLAVVLRGAKPNIEINIPVYILRSWVIGGQTYILVRSSLANDAVLWLKSSAGMKDNRNATGVLRWFLDEPEEKILYFWNLEGGKMNWREVTSEWPSAPKAEA